MAVAQLVESQIVILVVVGSSPISHPNKFNKLASVHGRGFFVFACDVSTDVSAVREPPVGNLQRSLGWSLPPRQRRSTLSATLLQACWESIPQVPTFAEAGVPGMVLVGT